MSEPNQNQLTVRTSQPGNHDDAPQTTEQRLLKAEDASKSAMTISWIALAFTAISAVGTFWNANTNANGRHDEGGRRDLEMLMFSLESASSHACAARSNIHGSHAFKMYFGIAVELEKRRRDASVPVHAYHALADLGSQILTFEQTKEFCELAISKSSGKYDKSLSYQQLGAAHFRFDGLEGNDANLRTARSSFQSAVDELSTVPHSARQIGLIYELWAAHEMYRGHTREALEKAAKAVESWNPLSDVESSKLKKELDKHLLDAKAGLEPNSPCRISASEAASSTPHAVVVPPLSRDKSLGIDNGDGTIRMRYIEVRSVADGSDRRPVIYSLVQFAIEANFPIEEELPERHYLHISDDTESTSNDFDDASSSRDNSFGGTAGCGC